MTRRFHAAVDGRPVREKLADYIDRALREHEEAMRAEMRKRFARHLWGGDE